MTTAISVPRARQTRRGRSRSSFALTALILAVIGLPPLLMYVGLASSMAAGVMAVCVSSLAFSLWRRFNSPVWPSHRGSAIAWGLAFICVHAVVVLLTGKMDAVRFALSLALLLIFLIGAISLGRQLFDTGDEPFHRAVSFTLVLLALSGALSLAGFAPYFGIKFEKPVFPFTEPSHFALSALAPFLYYSVISRGAVRQLTLIAGLVAALTLQNMTLLAAVSLTILICMRPLTLGLLSIPAVIAAPFLNLQYFALRLDFSPESDNLSALVFAQGWQLMGESLMNTRFWGVGFQQLGVFGTQVEFASLINALVGEDSNLSDGGFTLSKLVSEFGLFGLMATCIHLYFAGRFAMRLRATAHGPMEIPRSMVFAYAAVVSFTVDLFIRGNGYFTASSLMYMAACMHLTSSQAANHPRSRSSIRNPVTTGATNVA